MARYALYTNDTSIFWETFYSVSESNIAVLLSAFKPLHESS